MHTLLVSVNGTIFLLLSGIHVYWATGGTWGAAAAVPTKASGELLFKPRPFETWAVAIGLLGLAVFTWAQVGVQGTFISKTYIQYVSWGTAVVFLLRAVGEFRYVGLTKRVRGTTFAYFDDRYYTPLCVMIALISFGIGWLVG